MKFQVSRDTLGAMLRSMAYIREQLSNTVSSLGLFSIYHLIYPSNLKSFYDKIDFTALALWSFPLFHSNGLE